MEQETGFRRLRGCSDARIAGLVGLLVGDSLGVPFEFTPPDRIPTRHLIEMAPPVGFHRAHAGVPPGTWSDDGAQALCLLASLQDNGRLTLTDFASRLLRWLDDGYMAVDGHVFDVGIQTREALSRLRDGVLSPESGGSDEWSNGNGSLMRVLPLALWHIGTDEALVRDAHMQSLPTHAHPRSLVACAFYVLVARAYLRKVTDPWSLADQRLEEIYRGWQDQQERIALQNELNLLRSFPKTDQPRGTGYVLDTIWSARRAMEEEWFEDVARSAIRFGNDTDTTAAVACGLAGIKYGVDGVPIRWLEKLRGFEIVESLLTMWVQRPKPVAQDECSGIAMDGTPTAIVDWSAARESRRRKQ